MSLVPVTEPKQAKESFERLSANLKRGCKRFHRTLGWQGGGGTFDVYWNSDLQFWSLLDPKRTKSRYLCAFGTGDPSKRKNFGITCEVNPCKHGFNRRIAGAFLRDDMGRIFLAHNGKVGGGRKGIGKSGFLNLYQGALESVRWPDGRETELIVIGQIDDRNLPEKIAHFVYEVRQFKKGPSTRTGRLSPSRLPASFTPEFSGQRKRYETSDTIISQCDHGLIMSALAAELEKRKLKYGNDRPRDLFIVSNKGEVKTLFEAKTEVTTSSIYGAVGQLMLHGAAESVAPLQVLVLPQAPKAKTRSALTKLGIKVLTYARTKKGFAFGNLDAMLLH